VPDRPAPGGCRFLNPQLEQARDAWRAERYQHGEISQRPGYTDNQFRPLRDRQDCPN
jgi:folate-binding Fe-S cluster repair protein YgfZ